MTTLYEMLAGQNPYQKMALAILALDRTEIPRFRDATLIKPANPHESWMVGILTRTGSGGVGHDMGMSVLTDHLLHVKHADMVSDATYAIYTLRFPDELNGLGPWIERTEPLEGEAREDAWVSLFNKLNKLKTALPSSQYVLSMKKWIAPVIQQLVDEGKIDVVDVT